MFECNGRTYDPPSRPIVVVCIDGCADEYLDVSLAKGRMPSLSRILQQGYRGKARGCLPSFTNVNNAAIVSGRPPVVTGIQGNYFLDPESGEEVMMNDSSYLRCPTILQAASKAGRKVAMVTAKHKLLALVGSGFSGISFSAEKADQVTASSNGIADVVSLVGPVPEIYSPDASVYALRAGAVLIGRGQADFLYLSLTDYMQHTYPPEAPESLSFHARMDEQFGRLVEQGAILALTADHGMNSKTTPEGEPRVVYLEEALSSRFGSGSRVICPITDPYVKHHGALGSYVVVHLASGIDGAEAASWIDELEGVTEVLTKEQAARKLELPVDRLGDLVVMSARDWVIGSSPEAHDLSQLGASLRSHGGRYEEMVPFIVSEPLREAWMAKARGDVRNFDIFDFACNGTRG